MAAWATRCSCLADKSDVLMWQGLECTVLHRHHLTLPTPSRPSMLFPDGVRMNCWKLEPSSSFLLPGMGLLNSASASVSMMMQSSMPCRGTDSHSWCTNLEAAPPTPTTCTEHTQLCCCCTAGWLRFAVGRPTTAPHLDLPRVERPSGCVCTALSTVFSQVPGLMRLAPSQPNP